MDGVVGILTVGDVEQRARGGRVRQVGEDVAAAVGGARQRRLQRQRAQQRRAQLGAQPARAARRGGEHLAAALPRTHNAFTALRGDPSYRIPSVGVDRRPLSLRVRRTERSLRQLLWRRFEAPLTTVSRTEIDVRYERPLCSFGASLHRSMW